MASRVIGTFGGEKPGALVICIGALHGNEPAGVHALEMVFQQLAAKPELEFNGRFLGLIGNLEHRDRVKARDVQARLAPPGLVLLPVGEGGQALPVFG